MPVRLTDGHVPVCRVYDDPPFLTFWTQTLPVIFFLDQTSLFSKMDCVGSAHPGLKLRDRAGLAVGGGGDVCWVPAQNRSKNLSSLEKPRSDCDDPGIIYCSTHQKQRFCLQRVNYGVGLVPCEEMPRGSTRMKTSSGSRPVCRRNRVVNFVGLF